MLDRKAVEVFSSRCSLALSDVPFVMRAACLAQA